MITQHLFANAQWMGDYTFVNLIGIFIQSLFVENIMLSLFLGTCTFIACSDKMKTANGLGIAVVFVLVFSGILNWLVNAYITDAGALSWLSVFGIHAEEINLDFLRFIIFISVIAGFVQVVEIVCEKFTPGLYTALGLYLPLITVNCAILGGCLFAVARGYPFVPNLVYVFGLGVGWWLAIVLIAGIREKIAYSQVPVGLKGMGITFITSGLMAMAFMGLGGINLKDPSPKVEVQDTTVGFSQTMLAPSQVADTSK